MAEAAGKRTKLLDEIWHGHVVESDDSVVAGSDNSRGDGVSQNVRVHGSTSSLRRGGL